MALTTASSHTLPLISYVPRPSVGIATPLASVTTSVSAGDDISARRLRGLGPPNFGECVPSPLADARTRARRVPRGPGMVARISLIAKTFM
eukprot:6427978-Prymnesium_polylepis.2